MNPFSNLGKPLLSSWLSANSQSANYSNNHTSTPTERPKSTGSYNLPEFHTAQTADPKNLARPPPSYESYIHPNKRIRHNPLEFSEVHREPLTIPNQVRSGGRLEDQIQMQMQHGNKPSDESFMPQHPGMRKLPGNLPFGLQESGNFGTGANNANALFLKQQMEKSKKDLGLGESAQNTAPFNFQNEGLYNPVANNYGLANLLLNSYPNNVPMLELLQQQYQAKVQQLANFMQLNQLNQLLLNQQDLSKGNTLLRNTNLADPNNSLLRIPPLDSQSLFNYLAASSATPNNLGALFRTETGEKLRDSLAASEALKNLPLNIGLDKMEMSHMNKKTEPKLEEMHPLEMKSEGLIRGEDFQYKDPSILIRDEGTEHSLIDLAAQRRKNNQLQQRMTNMVNLAPFMKEPKDRRKNKWQMMLEQDDDFPSLKVSPFEKVGKGSKLMRADKRGFMSLSALQGKPTDVENYEELQGTMDAGSGRLLSFSQRKKKGENFSRSNGKFKNLQGKNRLLTEAQLYQGTYLNFNSLNDSDERGVNRMSITSSYGRTIDELTMDENDQKTVDTRFGPEYQAQILDLDLNASNTLVKRIPKQVWDPEAVEEKALTAYFDKLQSILNCKAINEEKAIRMLVKKNMIQEEVVVTIKKNEKFYSSFLGVSHTDKHSKHKKGR